MPYVVDIKCWGCSTGVDRMKRWGQSPEVWKSVWNKTLGYGGYTLQLSCFGHNIHSWFVPVFVSGTVTVYFDIKDERLTVKMELLLKAAFKWLFICVNIYLSPPGQTCIFWILLEPSYQLWLSSLTGKQEKERKKRKSTFGGVLIGSRVMSYSPPCCSLRNNSF